MSPNVLLPGSTIGIFGGGQLGRMICMEARRMGYHTCVLDPDPDCPAGQFSDTQIVADYSDLEAAEKLAQQCDVVTYEFENVDAAAIIAAEQFVTVHPSSSTLLIAQHRMNEKSELRQLGFPVPEFAPVDTFNDMHHAVREIGLPGVLKSVTSGYDGKGQAVIRNAEEVRAVYDRIRPTAEALIYERFIPFSKELSVICARTASGETRCFPVQENHHVNGVLDLTMVPARIDPNVSEFATSLVTRVTEALGVVGLLTVELFLTNNNTLLINEIAPRPHNSGHYTLDACVTSQFEQLVRAICGLPLGDVTITSSVVMANLLGDVWTTTCDEPDFAATMNVTGVKLHLYGKKEARPGRKMGHLTAVAPNVEIALYRATTARNLAMKIKPE